MGSQADRLREALVDQLAAAGTVRMPAVEAALRAVPRHVFVPEAPLPRAYADDVVQTKLDSDGIPISAASQPSIVAVMLEQLAVAPGDRVLEIGAGTGYNAALLARLAGDSGSVVTLDVDDDIVRGARAALAQAGFPGVTVIRGDGALGYAPRAPYDRIIATVGARDIPLAWQDQLAPDGRIVVPLRLRGSVTRSVAFRHAPEARSAPHTGSGREAGPVLRSVSSVMCGFMPMRASIASDERRTLPLTPGGDVLLEIQREQEDSVDPAALDDVLGTEPVSVPTGVLVDDAPAAEWLYLWLTCVLDSGLFRLQVKQSAIDASVVAPPFRWGAVGTIAGGSLAYLTLGPGKEKPGGEPPGRETPGKETPGKESGDGGTGDGTGSGSEREVGVIGHGSRGRDLAETLAERIRDWDARYRARTARFEIWPAGAAASPALTSREDLFVFPTPANTLVVSWEHESENLQLPSGRSGKSPV
ncbi:MAG TPA: methyltransferase, FxLD system [Trebonia sp.]|jgi:protein-L-isoaspartate(D-aspartate) O-methyltransferase|nr:methyltransferase, FxLD system [Trebonia sp.]